MNRATLYVSKLQMRDVSHEVWEFKTFQTAKVTIKVI